MNRTCLWSMLCITLIAVVFTFVMYKNIRLLQAEKNNVTQSLIRQISAPNYPIEITPLDTISPVLIYRYPEFSCDVCYKDDLELLMAFQNNVGADRICILPAFRENRENGILLNNELHGFNFLNMESTDELPLFERGGVFQRYFAVYEKDIGFKMIFFPDRISPESTKLYFDAVEHILYSASEQAD